MTTQLVGGTWKPFAVSDRRMISIGLGEAFATFSPTYALPPLIPASTSVRRGLMSMLQQTTGEVLLTDHKRRHQRAGVAVLTAIPPIPGEFRSERPSTLPRQAIRTFVSSQTRVHRGNVGLGNQLAVTLFILGYEDRQACGLGFVRIAAWV